MDAAKPPIRQASEVCASERLDSWKEIAAYLKRDESTVRRWEKEGLPVHRHVHDKKATVYAYKSEIDVWWKDGLVRPEVQIPGAGFAKAAPSTSRHLRLAFVAAAGFTVLLATVGLYLFRAPRVPTPPALSVTRLTNRGNLADSGSGHALAFARVGFLGDLDRDIFLRQNTLRPWLIGRNSALSFQVIFIEADCGLHHELRCISLSFQEPDQAVRYA